MSDIEIKSLVEGIATAFEAFKAEHKEQLAEIKRGYADTVKAEKVDRINADLSQLQQDLIDLGKKALRPQTDDNGRKLKNPEYSKAFIGYLKGSVEEREMKALTTTTNAGADGGFAVPEEIDRTIEKLLRDISPMREICGQVTIGTSDYKRLVNINGTSSGWVGETAARPETNTPRLAEVAIPPIELYANASATQIMLDDVFFDAESWLAESIAEEFSVRENAAFITGTGTTQPTGFLTGTPVTTGDATRAFGVLQYTPSGQAAALPTTFGPLIDLVATLRAGYRQRSVWLMGRTSVASLRKLADTTGQYLWQPSLQAGVPATLLGYPVYEAEDMPAVAANSFSIAFGDFKRGYLIVDRMGTRVLRDPYTGKPYIFYYYIKRVGGRLVNSDAIKVLRTSTT